MGAELHHRDHRVWVDRLGLVRVPTDRVVSILVRRHDVVVGAEVAVGVAPRVVLVGDGCKLWAGPHIHRRWQNPPLPTGVAVAEVPDGARGATLEPHLAATQGVAAVVEGGVVAVDPLDGVAHDGIPLTTYGVVCLELGVDGGGIDVEPRLRKVRDDSDAREDLG